MINRSDPVRCFLSSVAEARIEAQRLSFKRQRLEAQVTRITANLTGMPRGGGGDHELLLAKLADLNDNSEKARLKAEQQEEEVARFIDRLKDSTSRIILKLRYCECLDWSDTTRRRRRSVQGEMAKVGLAYSDRQIFRLHGKALNEARELYSPYQSYHVSQIKQSVFNNNPGINL